MECTQVLGDIDDFSDYKLDERQEVGILVVQGVKHKIYSGINRIGRDEAACSLHINSTVLSKQHAVIEIASEANHLVYDLGSTNKTRLNKLLLEPHVRYQLTDRAELRFGNIDAVYYKGATSEDGSPIKSEQDLIIPETPSPLLHKIQSPVVEVCSSSAVAEKCKRSLSELFISKESPDTEDSIFEADTQCFFGSEVTSIELKTRAVKKDIRTAGQHSSVLNGSTVEASPGGVEEQGSSELVLRFSGPDSSGNISLLDNEEANKPDEACGKVESEHTVEDVVPHCFIDSDSIPCSFIPSAEDAITKRREKMKKLSTNMGKGGGVIVDSDDDDDDRTSCEEELSPVLTIQKANIIDSGEETDPEDVFQKQTQTAMVKKDDVPTQINAESNEELKCVSPELDQNSTDSETLLKGEIEREETTLLDQKAFSTLQQQDKLWDEDSESSSHSETLLKDGVEIEEVTSAQRCATDDQQEVYTSPEAGKSNQQTAPVLKPPCGEVSDSKFQGVGENAQQAGTSKVCLTNKKPLFSVPAEIRSSVLGSGDWQNQLELVDAFETDITSHITDTSDRPEKACETAHYSLYDVPTQVFSASKDMLSEHHTSDTLNPSVDREVTLKSESESEHCGNSTKIVASDKSNKDLLPDHGSVRCDDISNAPTQVYTLKDVDPVGSSLSISDANLCGVNVSQQEPSTTEHSSTTAHESPEVCGKGGGDYADWDVATQVYVSESEVVEMQLLDISVVEEEKCDQTLEHSLQEKTSSISAVKVHSEQGCLSATVQADVLNDRVCGQQHNEPEEIMSIGDSNALTQIFLPPEDIKGREVNVRTNIDAVDILDAPTQIFTSEDDFSRKELHVQQNSNCEILDAPTQIFLPEDNSPRKEQHVKQNSNYNIADAPTQIFLPDTQDPQQCDVAGHLDGSHNIHVQDISSASIHVSLSGDEDTEPEQVTVKYAPSVRLIPVSIADMPTQIFLPHDEHARTADPSVRLSPVNIADMPTQIFLPHDEHAQTAVAEKENLRTERGIKDMADAPRQVLQPPAQHTCSEYDAHIIADAPTQIFLPDTASAKQSQSALRSSLAPNQCSQDNLADKPTQIFLPNDNLPTRLRQGGPNTFSQEGLSLNHEFGDGLSDIPVQMIQTADGVANRHRQKAVKTYSRAGSSSKQESDDDDLSDSSLQAADNVSTMQHQQRMKTYSRVGSCPKRDSDGDLSDTSSKVFGPADCPSIKYSHRLKTYSRRGSTSKQESDKVQLCENSTNVDPQIIDLSDDVHEGVKSPRSFVNNESGVCDALSPIVGDSVEQGKDLYVVEISSPVRNKLSLGRRNRNQAASQKSSTPLKTSDQEVSADRVNEKMSVGSGSISEHHSVEFVVEDVNKGGSPKTEKQVPKVGEIQRVTRGSPKKGASANKQEGIRPLRQRKLTWKVSEMMESKQVDHSSAREDQSGEESTSTASGHGKQQKNVDARQSGKPKLSTSNEPTHSDLNSEPSETADGSKEMQEEGKRLGTSKPEGSGMLKDTQKQSQMSSKLLEETGRNKKEGRVTRQKVNDSLSQVPSAPVVVQNITEENSEKTEPLTRGNRRRGRPGTLQTLPSSAVEEALTDTKDGGKSGKLKGKDTSRKDAELQLGKEKTTEVPSNSEENGTEQGRITRRRNADLRTAVSGVKTDTQLSEDTTQRRTTNKKNGESAVEGAELNVTAFVAAPVKPGRSSKRKETGAEKALTDDIKTSDKPTENVTATKDAENKEKSEELPSTSVETSIEQRKTTRRRNADSTVLISKTGTQLLEDTTQMRTTNKRGEPAVSEGSAETGVRAGSSRRKEKHIPRIETVSLSSSENTDDTETLLVQDTSRRGRAARKRRVQESPSATKVDTMGPPISRKDHSAVKDVQASASTTKLRGMIDKDVQNKLKTEVLPNKVETDCVMAGGKRDRTETQGSEGASQQRVLRRRGTQNKPNTLTEDTAKTLAPLSNLDPSTAASSKREAHPKPAPRVVTRGNRQRVAVEDSVLKISELEPAMEDEDEHSEVKLWLKKCNDMSPQIPRRGKRTTGQVNMSKGSPTTETLPPRRKRVEVDNLTEEIPARPKRTKATVKTPEEKKSQKENINSTPSSTGNIEKRAVGRNASRDMTNKRKNSQDRSTDSEVDQTPKKCSKTSSRKEPPPKSPLNTSIRSTPRRSTTRLTAAYCVMFTGLSDAKKVAAVERLGGSVVDDPRQATVLVTDKIRRTVKLLCAVGRGVPVVSPDWLTQSDKSGHFLEPSKFLLEDRESEKKFGFWLREALATASTHPLLQGYSVMVTSSVKPPPDEMKSIIECCGGSFLQSAPRKWPQNSFIVSAFDDKKAWPSLRKGGRSIVAAEAILAGVLRQALDLDAHLLS